MGVCSKCRVMDPLHAYPRCTRSDCPAVVAKPVSPFSDERARVIREEWEGLLEDGPVVPPDVRMPAFEHRHLRLTVLGIGVLAFALWAALAMVLR